jgi:hypothetical protein
LREREEVLVDGGAMMSRRSGEVNRFPREQRGAFRLT